MTVQRIGTSAIVAFAIGDEAGADAYLAFCEAANPDPAPGATWYPPDARDDLGRRIVAFMGPGTPGVRAVMPGEEEIRIAAGGLLGVGIDRQVEDVA